MHLRITAEWLWSSTPTRPGFRSERWRWSMTDRRSVRRGPPITWLVHAGDATCPVQDITTPDELCVPDVEVHLGLCWRAGDNRELPRWSARHVAASSLGHSRVTAGVYAPAQHRSHQHRSQHAPTLSTLRSARKLNARPGVPHGAA